MLPVSGVHAVRADTVMAAMGEEGVSPNSLWDAIRDHLQPLSEDSKELVRVRVEAFQRRCAVLSAQAGWIGFSFMVSCRPSLTDVRGNVWT